MGLVDQCASPRQTQINQKYKDTCEPCHGNELCFLLLLKLVRISWKLGNGPRKFIARRNNPRALRCFTRRKALEKAIMRIVGSFTSRPSPPQCAAKLYLTTPSNRARYHTTTNQISRSFSATPKSWAPFVVNRCSTSGCRSRASSL